MTRRSLRSTLFPYTTLFRSSVHGICGNCHGLPERGGIAMLCAGSRACRIRSEEHTSELQSLRQLVCRLLLEKKNLGSGHRDEGWHGQIHAFEAAEDPSLELD